MSNFKIKRQSDEFERETNVAGWLNQFAKSVYSQTAVDQARSRSVSVSTPSVNKRHATVADAVKDLQDRIGLKDYLGKLAEEQKLSKIASQIDEMSEEELKDALKRVEKDRGFFESLGLGDDYFSEEDEAPKSLAQYGEEFNKVQSFVDGTLKNTHNVSVSQLQSDLLSIAPNLDVKDVYNSEVEKYLSDKILKSKRNIAHHENYSNLGEGVGKDLGPDEDDPFGFANPNV